jgi:RNA recognition motif-containing protein
MERERNRRKDRIVSFSHPYQQRSSGGEGNTRVYVGNLDFGVSWQDLKDHMRTAGGKVLRADLLEDPQGKSKGCALVEYETERDAQHAIEILNNSTLNGRTLHVREDREGGKPLTDGGKNKQSAKGDKILVIENLPRHYTWQDLKDLFKGSGTTIIRTDIAAQDHEFSVGIVEFKSSYDANSALGNSALIATDDMIFRKPKPNESWSGTARQRMVFVNQIPFSVAWQDLKDYFRSVGEVTRADIALEDSGRSKGYGFVEFASDRDAERAIKELNDSNFRGRRIFVREFRE